MRANSLLVLVVSINFSGCGGGGGGASGVSYVRTDDFAQPVSAGSYQVFVSGSATSPIQDIFVQDLNGDSKEEVVIAGRQSTSAFSGMTLAEKIAAYEDSQISIYGWSSSDLLENQTSSWFSGTDNQIIGSEPSVKFADFDGDGNTDMALGHSTDIEYYGDLIVFKNTGSSSFTRENYDIGDKWMHDINVGDLNQDGYDDIVVGGYSTMVVMLGGSSGFTQLDTTHYGNSGLALGDFRNDGTVSLIFVDSAGGDAASDTHLYTFTQTSASTGEFTLISVLPDPLFEADSYTSVFDDSDEHSHDIRALPFDFNNDGVLDVVVVSVSTAPLDGVNRTEIQFLKNNGDDSFTDVTSTVRVGWDEFTNGDYNPQLVDVNDDGLIDILLSAQNWDSTETSRVLLQTSEGNFLESYATVFDNFYTAASRLESGIESATRNTIRFVVGPNSDKYLVTSITKSDGTNVVYTTKIGNLSGSTADASIAVLEQVWPYLTSDTAEQAILSTAFTNFEGYDPTIHGIGIIDLEKAMNPIGGLKIPSANPDKSFAISGQLSGVEMPGLDHIVAVDSLGRSFGVGINELHSGAIKNFWQTDFPNYEGLTHVDHTISNVYELGYYRFGQDETTGNQTIGFKNLPIYGKLRLHAQFSKLVGVNPFLRMSGMWGKVIDTENFEIAASYPFGDLRLDSGIIRTTTNLEPGLVTSVNPITSTWGSIAYSHHAWDFKYGVLPVIYRGSLDVEIPVSIDRTGRLITRDARYEIRNEPIQFISARFETSHFHNTKTVVSSTMDSTGAAGLKVNLIVNF